VGISTHAPIKYTSQVLADKVASVIDDEVAMAIGDGYDGLLYFTHNIEYKDGEVCVHVSIYQEFPEHLPDNTDVICVDVSAVRDSARGFA